ncbi:MAG: glycine--tRNA ligase subunit beta, partial [Acidobacteriota bacterium]|nr:glycine--tRNA ligase subunit beta [Acidobacteriota bacterium]
MNLLFEIGTEEIPDWMIPDGLAQMRTLFGPAETVQVDGTARRLTLRATGLRERQPDREEYVAGPAVSAPAQAVEGFARKQGIAKEALEQRDGKYGYTRRIAGRETRELLAHSLPELIGKIAWPKSMYWTAKGGARFIRPIRWIVALFGDEVAPFEFAGVRSGNESSGHRRMGGARFPVTFDTYEEALRANGVILS